MSEPVLHLERDEALVLFDCLTRELETKNAEPLRYTCKDEAELWALNSLLTTLEKNLAEPFSAEYAVHVAKAREAIRLRSGSWPSSKETD